MSIDSGGSEMQKNEPHHTQKLLMLLKQEGVNLTLDQLETLLKSNDSPDKNFFAGDSGSKQVSTTQVIRGYKVQTEYEFMTEGEMNLKKQTIARIICSAKSKIPK